MSLLTTIALLGPDALACGGFMCDNQQPVLQAAERIAFGVDEGGGEVEMHVQITYEGPSEDFAWLVPVPADPEVFLTTSLLFTQLPPPTQPTFTLNTSTDGECWVPSQRGGAPTSGDKDIAPPDLDLAGTISESDYFDVEVLEKQALGPYLIVELTAASVDDLTGWLQENGFDIPDEMGPVLEPYLLDDAVFVALKLAKDKDAGDLAPLGLRYAADQASVPVQLTSVAAAPDMRMEAYVFSNSRAVPESYLHVQINEAALDWWNQGANYDDVITQAANEAGGHAFATDYHGTTDVLPRLYQDFYNRTALVDESSPSAWVSQVVAMLTQIPPELAEVVEVHVPLPSGVTAAQYVGCPSCFDDTGAPFDPVAATDDLELMVIEPLRVAQALIDDHRYVSRMTSSLDAAEMTVDPTFVLNGDLASEEVSIGHVAEFVTDCTPRRTKREDALRRLELADGRELWVPSESWMAENNTTPFEYLQEHGAIAAQVIEQLGAQGDGEVIVDHSDDLQALADAHNDLVFDLFGRRVCGCTSTGGPAGALGGLALVGGLLLRRRLYRRRPRL